MEVTGGEGETWQKIRQTAEGKTYRSMNTKLKCTVKDKRPPGNCSGSSSIQDNDAVRCKISSV